MTQKFVDPLIAKAVESVGSQAKLATAAGCSQQLISLLLQGKVRVSAENAIKIDAATNGEVSKHDLRPDVFEAPAERSEEAAA